VRAPIVVLLALLAGCDPRAEAPADLGAQRTMLSEGYSMLHQDASMLGKVDAILYVKLESQALDDVLTAIGRYGGELSKDLERIARDYPGVRIDLKALPEMETRKRFAIGKDRMLRFAPLIGGGSREEFERTTLMGMANALNHESHLARVMAAEEPDAGLKEFLMATEKRYHELHMLTMHVLERDHFRQGKDTASAER
jgi:hypothetical protein